MQQSPTSINQHKDTRTTSVYYRLRVFDTDGSFKFSQVIYLAGNKSSGLMLWPNPAVAGQEVQLVLAGRNAKSETIQVIDAFGKVMIIRTVSAKSGRLETGIPTQNLAPGIYFITISDKSSGNVQLQKLVIVK